MYVDMEAREGNVDAARYLRVHQALSPKERNAHMPEQLCELAAVPAADLIAWVSRQVWQEGSAKAAMCMSFNRDKVLEKYAHYALESPDNYKHGELFMRASGLLPAPGRGGVAPISIFNMPVAASGSVAGVKSDSAPVPASGLRDMDSEIVELAKIMQTGEVDKYGIPDDGPDDDDDEDESDDD